MWIDFHKSEDRLNSIGSVTAHDDRIFLFGISLDGTLYVSRQTTALGIWTGWLPLNIPTWLYPKLSGIQQVASGTDASGRPLVFVLRSNTNTRRVELVVAVGTDVGADRNNWVASKVPFPQSRRRPASIRSIHVASGLPKFPTGPIPLPADLYVIDSNGKAFVAREIIKPGMESEWSKWTPIEDAGLKQFHMLVGAASCRERIVLAIDSSGDLWKTKHGLGNPPPQPLWKKIGGNGHNLRSVTAITDGNGVVHVVGITKDGEILHTHETRKGQCGDGRWNLMSVIPPASTQAPTQASSVGAALDDHGKVHLVVRRVNGELLQTWQRHYADSQPNSGNFYEGGGGSFNKFLPIFSPTDRCIGHAVISDKASRIHVFTVHGNTRPPQHALCWGYRIHLRAVLVRDDNSAPEPLREAVVTKEQFDRTLQGCNFIFRNTGIKFVFDRRSDWDEIANTAISRDSLLAHEVQTAHAAYSNRFQESIVCFLRHGRWEGPDGLSYSGWPTSLQGIDGNHVALSGFSEERERGNGLNQGFGYLMAHELGHFLGLQHTFSGDAPNYGKYQTATEIHSALISEVLRGQAPREADADLGDGIMDTPFDPGSPYFDNLERVGVVVSVTVPNTIVSVRGNFQGQNMQFSMIVPDINNAMSYWPGNPIAIDQTPPFRPPQRFSPDQIWEIHNTLRHHQRTRILAQPII